MCSRRQLCGGDLFSILVILFFCIVLFYSIIVLLHLQLKLGTHNLDDVLGKIECILCGAKCGIPWNCIDSRVVRKEF